MAELVSQNIPHLQAYLPAVVSLTNVEQAESHIQMVTELSTKGELHEWLLFYDGALCGNIRIKDIDQADKTAKMGYFVGDKFQRKGIVTMSARAILGYCFDTLGINRIELRCATDNTPSVQVAERLGFVREGMLRQAECLNGQLVDLHVYGLLAHEFKVRVAC